MLRRHARFALRQACRFFSRDISAVSIVNVAAVETIGGECRSHGTCPIRQCCCPTWKQDAAVVDQRRCLLYRKAPANGRDQMRRLFILLMILEPLVACQTGCRTCRPCGCASSSGTYSEIQAETRKGAIVACPSGACPSIQAVTEELRTAKALSHPNQAPLPPTPIADPL